MNRIALFGEVLYDVFTDNVKVIGGAPFNVAWHLQAFGLAPTFISSVGDDQEGREVRQSMQDWGMTTDGVMIHPTLATGRVNITLSDGEPTYDIIHPVAYDEIDLNSNLANPYELIYAGSLALRDEHSRQSFERLIAKRHDSVFIDINLREPWFELPTLDWLLNKANWVKLNQHEYTYLCEKLLQDKSVTIATFMSNYHLDGLILTLGEEGAELHCTDGYFHVAPTGDIEVLDAVGAGDAFASVIITGLVNGWSYDDSIERAQEFASIIVNNRGATLSDPTFYQDLITSWSSHPQSL